jgi:DNA (cytosine-5)-methyltransferase 1
MKFIDLFAGIGGFHIALEKLGHSCVFASEKKEGLAQLYFDNFGIEANRDITKVEIENIPSHDILCAGFPCQPFSKAGSQFGLEDKKNGNLFNKLAEILEYHKPRYFILENVRNLLNHDDGNTIFFIEKELKRLGYTIDKEIYSPHHMGIPQHRERLFIVGSLEGLNEFKWPKKKNTTTSITEYLDVNPLNAKKLEKEKINALNLWQELINIIPKTDKLPSFPIWCMEFGATYPFENETPFCSDTKKLDEVKGAFGVPLKDMSRSDKFKLLPRYARNEEEEFPLWKKNYIRRNREFYDKYKSEIKPVIDKIKKLNTPSWQKFEWNVQGGIRDISKYIIQFRGSGIRVKKTDFFPSLVTVSTQIPILGWENRYITPKEGSRIQSLNGIKLPDSAAACYTALGNAVNADIVKSIANELINNSNQDIIN